MSTLLLRLAAPLQSWGIDSRFDTRRTERLPSKSGVIGLVAAALGLRRDADLSELCALRFGVRVDRDGELLRDFHTAHHPSDKNKAYVTNRHYIADAVFIAGLESDDRDFLDSLDKALRAPVYPLFLGRRSCPPTLPLSLGVRDADLYTSLKTEPWQVSEYIAEMCKRRNPGRTPMLRIVTDEYPGARNRAVLRDLPESFDPRGRRYGFRAASDTGYIAPPGFETGADLTEHDPFSELEAD